jgi:putative transposase
MRTTPIGGGTLLRMHVLTYVPTARHFDLTFYTWKAEFGGMQVSDVAKMRTLEDENRRLKRIVADQALNIDALKIVASGTF